MGKVDGGKWVEEIASKQPLNLNGYLVRGQVNLRFPVTERPSGAAVVGKLPLGLHIARSSLAIVAEEVHIAFTITFGSDRSSLIFRIQSRTSNWRVSTENTTGDKGSSTIASP